MGAMGGCCCSGGVGCVRTDLPLTFTFDGTTIGRNDGPSLGLDPIPYFFGWNLSEQFAAGCCWTQYYGTTQRRYGIYDLYDCSAEVSVSASVSTKLVAIYRQLSTQITFAKATSMCDSQVTPVSQYIVTIMKFYQGFYQNVTYNPPSPSCVGLGQTVLGWVFGGPLNQRPVNILTFYTLRRKYYSSLPTGSYTLTPSDVSTCNQTCQFYLGDYVYDDFSLAPVTISTPSTGQSITFSDSTNWTFSVTN